MALLLNQERKKKQQSQKQAMTLPQLENVVPKTQALCELLDLSPDIFAVRSTDLVRKATDELAWGLSWYVLFTLVYSAVDHLPAPANHHKLKPSQTKLFYKLGNIDLDEDDSVKRKTGGKKKDFYADVSSKGKLLGCLKDFTDEFAHLDVRSLLNNVIEINKAGKSGGTASNSGGRFYTGNVSEYGEELKKLIRFFFHRNGTIGKDLDSNRSDDVEAMKSRNQDAAKRFFWLLPKFLQCIKSCPIPKEWDEFQRVACAQLHDAAMDHFNNAKNIRNTYCVMFTTRPTRNPPPEFLTSTALIHLLARLENDINGEEKLAQTIMLGLWTRFGAIHKSATAEDIADAEDKVIADFNGATRSDKRNRPCLVTKEVRRYAVGNGAENKYLTNTNTFLTDPVGVTHVDIFNRGLDVVVYCLRRLLIEAIQRDEQHLLRDPSFQTSDAFFAAVCLGIDGKVKDIVPDNTTWESATPFAIKNKQNGATQQLLELFRIRVGLNEDDPKLVSTFVRNCAHFCDPRSVAHFITNLEQYGYPNAKELQELANEASHQYNLHVARHLTCADLKRILPALQTLVEGLSDAMDIPRGYLNQMLEYRAMKDLNEVCVPYYIKWHSRKYIVVDKMTVEQINTRARVTLTSLLKATNPELVPIPNLSVGVDGSADALRSVLWLIDPTPPATEVTAAQEGQKADVASNVVVKRATSNPWAALFDDEESVEEA